jgi:hypothetical protein
MRVPPAEQLPNLFVIGAAGCGTADLHRQLDAHPEIAMSDPRQPRVFADAGWRQRLGEYAGMFSAGAPVRGESSTPYSSYPLIQGIPERVASTCPRARIVYVVRDPIERVVASWTRGYAAMREHRTLANALKDLDQPGNEYVAASRYATQLEQWLERFEPERVLVIDRSELRGDGSGLARILRFLGVGPAPRPAAAGRLARDTEEAATPTAARLRLGRIPLLRRIGRPALDEDLRAALAAELSDEANRFRQLTGMRFASWSI